MTATYAATMTERDLQQALYDAARLHQWLCYHAFDARRSTPGFPDLICVKGNRLLALELKSAKGTVKAPQAAWIRCLRQVPGVTAAIVRAGEPRDGEIGYDDALALLATNEHAAVSAPEAADAAERSADV